MAWRLLGVGATAVLLGCFAYVWPFSVDDSYIVAQYGNRLAQGLGYTFREGPATDGVTGPLWLVPLSAAARVGLDPAVSSKLLGGLCAVGTLLLLVWELRRRSLGLSSALFATAFVLTAVPFLTWPVAGLETAGAALASMALAVAVTARPRVCTPSAAVAAACLPWLRPELVPFAGALLVYAGLRERRAGLWIGGALLGSALAVLWFRVALFGHALPMVAAAKPAVLGHGATYVFAGAVRMSTTLFLGLLAWCLRYAGARERVLVAALFVHAFSVLLAGGDWMPGLRLFAPVVAVTGLLLGPLLARWLVHRGPAVLVATGLLLGLRAYEAGIELREARRGGLELTRTARELTAALRNVDGAIVALDVGALAYGLPNDVIDLGGLTEPRVAYAPGGHLDKRIDPEWLAETRPARIVLHSREAPRVDARGHVRWFAGYPVERRVLAMHWVLEGYRVERIIEHAANYYYVVLGPVATREP